MGNADFEGRRPPGRGGWWSWRPVQHALHHLWMTGALTIHSRQHFQKRYDLLERAMPDALGQRAGLAGRVPALAPRALAPRHGRGDRARSGALSHVPALRAGRAAPGASRHARARRGHGDRGRGIAGPLARAHARPAGAGARRAGDLAVARDDAALAVRLAALAPRPRRAAVRLRLPHRGLHARARSACTATTRCRSSITASSSAASTPRPIAPSAGSRSATCTSSPGSPRPRRRRRGAGRWIRTRRSPAWPTALGSLGVFVGARRGVDRARHAAAAAGAADAMSSCGAAGRRAAVVIFVRRARRAPDCSASRGPCAQ